MRSVSATLVWLALLFLLIAAALAVLRIALVRSSLSALHRRLAERGRAETAEWLAARLDMMAMSLALFQTAASLSVFGVILLDVAATGESHELTPTKLLIAGAISLFALWICNHVVAVAIARYAGVGLIVALLPLLRVIHFVGYPLARGYGFVDEVVRRLTGANKGPDDAEEELLRSIEDTQRRGALDDAAATLLENVVEFSGTDVGEVMTPRTDVEGIELTNDLGAIRSFIIEAGHSRIPVYEESLDDIKGILYVKDLVPFLGENVDDFELLPLLRQPIFVPETKEVGELLSDFQRSEVHMAIVIDEYGGTSGLATIEDVLEEIVGEIQDEHDPVDDDRPELVSTGAASVEVDGRFHIDDFNARLGLDLPEEEEYDTLGGFMMAVLGRVPRIGDEFEAHSARFRAIQATPTQVRRIEVHLLTPAAVNGDTPADGK